MKCLTDENAILSALSIDKEVRVSFLRAGCRFNKMKY